MSEQNETTGSSWEIWSYDVWGNEEEGYTVNDRCKLDTIDTESGELPDEIIEQLIRDYFGDPEYITVDHGISDDEHIYLVLNDEEVSDYPAGEIIKDF